MDELYLSRSPLALKIEKGKQNLRAGMPALSASHMQAESAGVL
jgi:hypothetical protein